MASASTPHIGLFDPATGATTEAQRYVALLDGSEPVRQIWAGPAFSFPTTLDTPDGSNGDVVAIAARNAALLEPLLSGWISDAHRSLPLMALVVSDRAVAVCGSVRATANAHEAGVETAPAFRGRGYAGLVVTAWAREVRARNAEPLYSTSWQNSASRAVARKCGLIAFGSDLHLT